MESSRQDHHSYANLEAVRVRHVALDLTVDFEKKILTGTCDLTIERTGADRQAPLVLDAKALTIFKAEQSADGKSFTETTFSLGTSDPILGAPLTVQVAETTKHVRISYQSSPAATGLQWLTPAQTAGKKDPFLFSQSEPIYARTWIPLQDSPQVRITYAARIRTPRNLLAVMSAENEYKPVKDGDYRFQLRRPIPPYLIALAVGDLDFRPLGKRSGVYAEPSVVEKAAFEFSDTEKMMTATEKLYGPYRWGRYDILVLPPSFPFGGMENPMMTFATPTILAGDKSLVSLISHELAHSWSGNLVTNATWSDFWLNEGFTTYLERRIVEALYGRERAEMEAVLGRQDLQRELDAFEDRDEILHIDLKGRDPEDGQTQLPYEKGVLLLRQLEETFGRQKFDRFLRGYFDHFAFKSITTADFEAYLHQHLLDRQPRLAAKIPLKEWMYQPGLPASAPVPKSDAFAQVETAATAWLEGKQPAVQLPTKNWSTQQWVHFLRFIKPKLKPEQLTQLDQAFKLTETGNAEIALEWLTIAIAYRYEKAYPALETYLLTIGRRRNVRPLYQELVKTPEGKMRAKAIYAKARSGYHPITQAAVDEIVAKD